MDTRLGAQMTSHAAALMLAKQHGSNSEHRAVADPADPVDVTQLQLPAVAACIAAPTAS